MKLCFLADAKATHIKRWARYFSEKGHEVHLVTFNPDMLEGYGGVSLHLVRNKKVHLPTVLSRAVEMVPFLFRVKALLKIIDPDILHAHSVGGYGWLGMLTGFKPYVITPWGNDVLIDIYSSRFDRFFTAQALKRADLITCDGLNTREAMVGLGVKPGKIIFNYFGTDVNKFTPDVRDTGLRASLFPDNARIIISTRFLTPVHDVATLVSAIPRILQQVPEARFIIIGDGPGKDELVSLAGSLNVLDFVKFAGRIEENEMPVYLASSDVYVSTSLSESGLAASTAEAMACGLPVINTDTGDIGRWLTNGEGGFIIPSGDPDSLTERVVSVLTDDGMREKAGRLNRRVIVERLNYFTEMAAMETVYLDLAANRLP